MEITEVRIKLMDDPHERLQAFCSVTFDSCFVIRDLKIIQGTKGSFVAMPSRKLTDRCPRCSCKNHLRAQFCNQCGARLDDERAIKNGEGRAKLYADIAHPINSDCRELIQQEVIKHYDEELLRSKQPGYICTYDDYGEDQFATLYDEDENILPISVRAAGDTSHRIEPPSRQPNPPHRNLTATADRSHASIHRSDEEDSFGVGIV